MNPQLTDQPKKSNPWVSAFVCLGASIAAPSFAIAKFAEMLSKFSAYPKASEAELKSIAAPYISSLTATSLPILAVAIIAGILNIVFVMKGGRKWSLIISSIGILISLATIGLLTITWMKVHG